MTAPFCGWVLTLKVKAAPSGSVPVIVKVAGVSSLVVMVKLFTVGACGAGSLLVGLEEQVQMNKMLKKKMIFLILIIYKCRTISRTTLLWKSANV